MSQVLTIICLSCQQHNRVAPVVVDGPLTDHNGPSFIPETCGQCRRLLRPSTDEWNSLLFALVANGCTVQPDWWQTYARRHPPVPSDTPTA